MIECYHRHDYYVTMHVIHVLLYCYVYYLLEVINISMNAITATMVLAEVVVREGERQGHLIYIYIYI